MQTPRPPGTRAKDSDRVAACQLLDSAFGEGQLSMDEHQQRVDAATKATTLGQLRSLVGDLQPDQTAHPSAPRPWLRGRRPVVVAGAALVVSTAIGWALLGNDESAPTDDAGPSSQTQPTHALAVEPSAPNDEPDVPPVVLAPPGQLHTADGIASVLDAMRKRFGDTMGFELAISPNDATLARPDPADDRSKLIYPYRGGWGDPYRTPRSDTDDVTDLGAFDIAAAAAALQAAPDTLRIAPDDVDGTFLDIDHIADADGPGALELLVKVSTKSGPSGFIYLDGASNIKRVEYPN